MVNDAGLLVGLWFNLPRDLFVLFVLDGADLALLRDTTTTTNLTTTLTTTLSTLEDGHVALDAAGHPPPRGPSSEDAADGPGPDYYGDEGAGEQGGHEHHEGEPRPEEGEGEGADEGEGGRGEGEDGEDEDGEEAEYQLGEDKCLGEILAVFSFSLFLFWGLECWVHDCVWMIYIYIYRKREGEECEGKGLRTVMTGRVAA